MGVDGEGVGGVGAVTVMDVIPWIVDMRFVLYILELFVYNIRI